MTRKTLFAAASLVLGLPPSALAAENWHRTFTAGDHPKIVITASDANVRVHARPGPTVEARVTAKGKTVGLYFGSRQPKSRSNRAERRSRSSPTPAASRRRPGLDS